MIHNVHRRRILMCFLMVVAGFGVVIMRLVQLQVYQEHLWNELLTAKAERRLPLKATRGKILSATGSVLAQSIPVNSLYADPYNIQDPRAVARDLAPLLEMDPALIQKKLTKPPEPSATPAPPPPTRAELSNPASPSTTETGILANLMKVIAEPPPPSIARKRVKSKFVWVKRKLSNETYASVKQLIDAKKLKGLGFRREFQRVYPNKQLAAQVLGFVGAEEDGLEGLEHKYNHILGGKPGERRVIMAPNGMILHELNRLKPEGFNDIHLTIDPVIQHYVERELDKAFALHNPKNCFAAAMDPNTGEILAMAVRPTFDPNEWRQYDRETWKNRVITDQYEPGSPFKLVTVAAALEDQRCETSTTFYCPGKIVLWDIPLKCLSVHETITTEQVIERSCNTGAAKIGELLGPKNLYYYIRKFGFGDKTGIDLPSEVEGLVRPPEKWSGVSIGAVSIGQEIAVSGIQMMQAVATIANGGRLVRPHVISKVTDSETGAIVQETALDVRHRVISSKVTEGITKMMAMVTKSGSGTNGALDDYIVAGKTGTSEKLSSHGRFGYVASFIGFVPAKEPKVLIYVVLNEPKGEKVRGGSMAAPVFREIARQVMLLKKVPPEVGAGTPVTQPAAPEPGPKARDEEDEEEEEEPAAPAPKASPEAPATPVDEEGEGPEDAESDARVGAGADE